MTVSLLRTLGVCLFLVPLGCADPPAPPEDGGRAVVEAAQAAIEGGNPREAIGPLQDLVAVRPEDALARAVLAHAHLLVEEVEAALVQGKLAVGIDPALSAAAWNLSCAYARLGDRDAAVAWLQRALAMGAYGPDDVREDEDLAGLVEDHRIAVYLAAGVLSRAEEDAIAQLDRDRARVGEPVILSVALVQLNRVPLSTSTAGLSQGQDRGLPFFELVARRETFTRGEAGGREYAQRTVHFELLPRAAGTWTLGPFRVLGDGREHWTTPVVVRVEGDETPVEPSRPELFGMPSATDPGVIEQLGGDDLGFWEPGQTPQGGPLPQAVRFRVPTLEGEISLPPRPRGSVRSTFLRRSTEGDSWVGDDPDS